jgi:hypothetical protein
MNRPFPDNQGREKDLQLVRTGLVGFQGVFCNEQKVVNYFLISSNTIREAKAKNRAEKTFSSAA